MALPGAPLSAEAGMDPFVVAVLIFVAMPALVLIAAALAALLPRNGSDDLYADPKTWGVQDLDSRKRKITRK